MDRRVRHTVQTRIEAARLFDAGFGYSTSANLLAISRDTARDWLNSHRQGRLLGLSTMERSIKTYSTELKLAAVEKFLAGANKNDVLEEFAISSRSLFNKWLVIYRDQGASGLAPKVKGRPTKNRIPGNETLEQKIYRLEMENALLKKFHALMEQEQALKAKRKRSLR